MARLAAALLLLVAATAAAAADSLGTLFLTPEERARLDSLRRGDAQAAPGAPVPRDHALTGFVQRSDGRTTVWIDGHAVTVPARRDGERGERCGDACDEHEGQQQDRTCGASLAGHRASRANRGGSLITPRVARRRAKPRARGAGFRLTQRVPVRSTASAPSPA